MLTHSTTAMGCVDEELLLATLELARGGRDAVEPDPYVGALIVDDAGVVLGRGLHATNGGTHAEPVALAEAGALAAGATLYCNLEPCGYEAPEKRQPACTGAIIEAGIRRVVVGQIDPHPRVRGAGLERLREAGVALELTPEPRPYWRANPVFTTTMTLERPLLHVVTDPAALDPAVGPWHDADRMTDGSAEVHSVRLHAPDPNALRLPPGWQIDYRDGRPTEDWFAALEAAT